jgi:dienelactone hydrolase
MRYLIPVTLFFVLLFAAKVDAAIRTETVEYKDGDTLLEGFLAYDDSLPEKRPGVMVVHEWWGINDYTKKRTVDLARLGFVAFAADIYGKGIRPKTRDEAGKEAGKYRADRTLLRRRANAGLEELRKNRRVDGGKLAAIGYCFGGGTVLELARSGADVAGVVSFHGNLDTPNPGDAKNIKGKVLVLHGANDNFVNPQVTAFQDEMRSAGVDWQMNIYSGAVHGFTNPDNGSDPSKGLAYNAAADRRSWEAMEIFFNELFFVPRIDFMAGLKDK